MDSSTTDIKHPYLVTLPNGTNTGIDPAILEKDGVRLEHVKGHEYVLHMNGKAIPLVIEQLGRKDLRITMNHLARDVSVADHRDQLLEGLGLEDSAGSASRELISPMPGLVLSTAVQAGDVLQKGSPILVLEAMKMENEIKAESDVTVSRVAVQAGDAVQKGQLLIEFE